MTTRFPKSGETGGMRSPTGTSSISSVVTTASSSPQTGTTPSFSTRLPPVPEPEPSILDVVFPYDEYVKQADGTHKWHAVTVMEHSSILDVDFIYYVRDAKTPKEQHVVKLTHSGRVLTFAQFVEYVEIWNKTSGPFWRTLNDQEKVAYERYKRLNEGLGSR